MMISRLLCLFAVVALFGASAPVRAMEESADPLIKDAPAREEAPAETANTAPKAATPEVCEITGVVGSVEKTQRSPWADGAPSAMMVTEVRVSVVLDNRMPRHGDKEKTGGKTGCVAGDMQGKALAYKLCSPTHVKRGDFIRATEGSTALDPSGLGCLFDVAVLRKG